MYSAAIISQEKGRLTQLGVDMIDLKSELNQVKDGWKYDEYCTGYGSDITRNNKKVCYIRLENSEMSTNNRVTFKDYTNVIDSNTQFNQSGVSSKIENEESFTQTSRYSTDDGYISCDLRSITSSTGDIIGTSLFTCFGEAKDYYFERRNG